MVRRAGRRISSRIATLALGMALLVGASACALPLPGATSATSTAPAATAPGGGIFGGIVNPITSHPVSSTVYAVGDEGTLDAFDSVTGAAQWRVAVGGHPSPADNLPGDYLDAVSTGIVFVTAAQADPSFPHMPGVGLLNAIDPQTQHILWTTHRTVIFLATQAGVVYVSDSTGVAALNARTDQRFWHYDEPQAYPRTFALGDGVAYLSYAQNAQSAYLDAIRLSDGARLWRQALQGSGTEALALSGGVVYAAASSPSSQNSNLSDHQIAAFDAGTGQRLWSATMTGANLSLQVANGQVYVHMTGNDVSGVLKVLNAQSGQASQGFSSPGMGDGCVAYPPFVAGAVLYVPCGDPGNVVLAFNASSGALIWQRPAQKGFIRIAGAADGVVYEVTQVSGSESSSTLALQASAGASLWQHPGGYLLATGGVAFVSNGAILYALDAANGRPLWQSAALGAHIQALGA